ncbi:MAG: YceI family protein [Ignavibacteriaceae bacterium]|nr:YceI family protein [Ignavibacteriaceae bacterium]
MKLILNALLLIVVCSISALPQGFDVKAKGTQTFSFKDDKGRNQATFHSITPFDEVDGLTTEISGQVSFNIKDLKNTLKGEISLPTESLKTGIKMRDKDLKEPKWLDAEKYPVISFKIKKVIEVKKTAPNKLTVKVIGDFYLHGVTKEIQAEVTMMYLDESAATQAREPGDLVGVTGNFSITLSKFNVQNMILGKRVSDNIDIGVNIVGTNKF